MIGGYCSARRGWRPWTLVGLASASLLVGCGSNRAASTTAGPAFPDTPAGEQARWLVQAFNHLPVTDAALRTHVSPVMLSRTTSAEVNRGLVGVGQVRLVSVARSQARSIAFVISVRGGQRFQAALTVDANGLVTSVQPMQALPSTASPQSMIPRLASGWVAQPVTFDAGGVTIYGTYTHPRTAAAGSIPGAVLLAGAGPSTDRNDNCTSRCWTRGRPPGSPDQQLGRNALAAVANWLSADGVASVRYDKLGSGQTGWGPYAAHPDRVGITVYEQEAAAALRFVAGQRQTNRARLAVFGHSGGGIYALLLAAGLPGAPKVHAVGLLEPMTTRFLSVFTGSRIGARVVAYLRRTGALPAGLPAAVSNAFRADGTPLELSQLDHYDPATLASRLAPRTPVLLSCSNADMWFTCGQEDRIARGLTRAHAALDYVHLDGVDHMLKEDLSREEAGFNQALPFSAQLRARLRTFAADNL